MKQSRAFSVYDPKSGDFTGQILTFPDDHLENNLAMGMRAFPGRHDRERFAVGHADDGFGNLSPALVRRLPPRPEDTPARSWEWCEQADTWVGVPTLSGARLARWQEIKDARDGAASSPFIVVGARPWQVCPASIAAIRSQLDVADTVGGSWSVVWTFADNSRGTVFAADLRAVLAAVGLRAHAAHQRAQALRQAIDAAASMAEVNTVEWTGQ